MFYPKLGPRQANRVEVALTKIRRELRTSIEVLDGIRYVIETPYGKASPTVQAEIAALYGRWGGAGPVAGHLDLDTKNLPRFLADAGDTLARCIAARPVI